MERRGRKGWRYGGNGKEGRKLEKGDESGGKERIEKGRERKLKGRGDRMEDGGDMEKRMRGEKIKKERQGKERKRRLDGEMRRWEKNLMKGERKKERESDA